MVYIAYFTELILQICNYAQKRRIWRENCKYAFDENFHCHFYSRRKAAKFCHPAQDPPFCNSRPTGFTDLSTKIIPKARTIGADSEIMVIPIVLWKPHSWWCLLTPMYLTTEMFCILWWLHQTFACMYILRNAFLLLFCPRSWAAQGCWWDQQTANGLTAGAFFTGPRPVDLQFFASANLAPDHWGGFSICVSWRYPTGYYPKTLHLQSRDNPVSLVLSSLGTATSVVIQIYLEGNNCKLHICPLYVIPKYWICWD